MTKSLLKAFIVVAVSHSGVATEAFAQAPDQEVSQSLSVVKGQLPAGEILHVTDASGTTTKGKLTEITNDAIEIRVNREAKSIRAIDVRVIQWQKQDSLLNGVVIGGAIGAIPGIYWLIADPNECVGLCAEDYVAIGVGALVGGLIDRAIKKKVIVYDAASRKTTTVIVSPLLARDRRGLRVALTF